MKTGKPNLRRGATEPRRPRARPPDVSAIVQCFGGGAHTAGDSVGGLRICYVATSLRPQLKLRRFSGGTLDMIPPIVLSGEPGALQKTYLGPLRTLSWRECSCNSRSLKGWLLRLGVCCFVVRFRLVKAQRTGILLLRMDL